MLVSNPGFKLWQTRGVIITALVLAVVGAACGGGRGDGTATPAGESVGLPSTAGNAASGGKIAFVSFRDGNQEIYAMNADGSDQRNLTNHPADDFDPDWAPDGTRLAFISNRHGQPQIYVMDGSGSNLRQLTWTAAASAPAGRAMVGASPSVGADLSP